MMASDQVFLFPLTLRALIIFLSAPTFFIVPFSILVSDVVLLAILVEAIFYPIL